jgi:hypothetical protein
MPVVDTTCEKKKGPRSRVHSHARRRPAPYRYYSTRAHNSKRAAAAKREHPDVAPPRFIIYRVKGLFCPHDLSLSGCSY